MSRSERSTALVCVDVITAARLLTELMSRRLAEHGVTIGQLPVLLALYEEDGLTQSELARRTGVEQPTMAVSLRRMDRDGLVRRVPDPGDHRKSQVCLTARSLDLRDSLQRQRADLDQTALAGLSAAERADLQRFLVSLARNLATDG